MKTKQCERWTLTKNSMFFMRCLRNYDLSGPTVIVKEGTVVDVVKVSYRYSSMLLRYTDRSGKVWLSWTYRRRNT